MTLDALRMAFAGRLLTDPSDVAPFLEDWRKLWRGRALAVAQPDTPEDVARLMRWCAETSTPVVPQGGNTGMSGGATPDESGRALVLSLARLNRIRRVDLVNDTITVDAGCILQTVQEEADRVGRLFPLSLAAEGSCTIGGNLATNAGGTAVLRYGTARELCLGLEVATAAGELWNGLTGLRKDNSGYALRDLFIGSEGTLGIITGAVLKLFPRTEARVVAFVAVESPSDALTLLGAAKERFRSLLTAFELISETCLGLVINHLPSARRPLRTVAPWYVLVEFSGSNELALREALETLLAGGFEDGSAQDATISQSDSQSLALWTLREAISEAQGAEGKTIKHDIALPISAIAGFLYECDAAVSQRWPNIRFVVFGHLGDGNLHYNFSTRRDADDAAFIALQDEINALVHDHVRAHGGTISAEHGLGKLRHIEADRFRSAVDRRLHRAIKTALDPCGILNPGKVIV